MRTIEQETTALNEYGLGLDLILSGEKAEIDPETKINAKKNKYILHDVATKIIDAYAEDLLTAYRAIEELEGEIDRLSADLDETSKAVQTSNGQVKKLLAGEQELANAEKLLAKFEQQMDTLAKGKEMDKTVINNLTAQVNELIELRDTVPQLEADVNAVLENLRTYFEEEGIPMDDGEYDDGYVQ